MFLFSCCTFSFILLKEKDTKKKGDRLNLAGYRFAGSAESQKLA